MNPTALAAVAAALSRVDVSNLRPFGESTLVVEEWRVGERRGVPRDSPPATFWHRWSTVDPSEALEVLATRGLVPSHWTDPALAPAWWWCRCAACEANRHAADSRCESALGRARGEPALMVDLVSVAALGEPSLRIVEEIVREAARDAVVWRVRRDVPRPPPTHATTTFQRALADAGVLLRESSLGLRLVDVPRV